MAGTAHALSLLLLIPAALHLGAGASLAAEPTPPAEIESHFKAHGPGLTVGNPRTLILDSPRYTLAQCLRECLEGAHGACVAATFHRGNECKLFSSYTGIKRSVVADKVAYIKK
jgi:hypothetical protein